MPNLTVRDIPKDVYERLRKRAASNRRSMSAEIVKLLEQAVLPNVIDVDSLIAEAETAHARFKSPLPDLISEGKRTGRTGDLDLPLVAEPDVGQSRITRKKTGE